VAILARATLLGALCLVVTGKASAQADDAHRLEWTDPEFRPVEYGFLLGVPLVYVIVDRTAPQPVDARWSSSNVFDDPWQSLLGDSSQRTRDRADLVGTIAWQIVRAYPIVDAVLVSAADDWNYHVAWQMLAIDLTAMMTQALVKLILVRSVARHRPSTVLCLERGGTEDQCLADNTKSFPSGHAMSAFTSAGLACAHHGGLPLYGGGAPDTIACVAALALATTTGVSRVIADKHYMSDVLVAAGLGLSIGWLLPYVLHYQHEPSAEGAAEEGPSVVVAPLGDFESTFGVSAMGFF
jgi:membrane-associated phospholipid phosphatase